jgi:LacI family transcriptional regulator
MATINDVARRAGVSIKTVSRVINLEPHVRPATRARVLGAMRELGYVANVSAQRLASGRVNAIGFVFQNPSWQYMQAALQGVLEKGRQDGYDVLMHPCDAAQPAACENLLDLVARRSVDGFIFTPPCDVLGGVLSDLETSGVPFVRINPRDRSTPFPYVIADDRQGAYEMTRYLLELGHRRIGLVTGTDIQIASQERLEGYRQALVGYGLPVSAELCVGGAFTFESGLAAGRALLDLERRPTAIFACNDDMAAGVLAAAHEAGMAVPEALSVAGFDNTPLAWQVWPALTTVAQPIYDMALLATDILIRTLRGEDLGVQHHTLQTKLVIRESTAGYRGQVLLASDPGIT